MSDFPEKNGRNKRARKEESKLKVKKRRADRHRLNDDATYNRSNVSEGALMAIGFYDMCPSLRGRGDSMG